MPFQLNDKIKHLAPYEMNTGDFAIRLDANESFLPISDEEQAGLQAALAAANLRRYPDPSARKLCQAAAAFYGTKPSLVTAFNGSDEALFLLCTAFLGRGTTLLSFEGDFAMYRFYADLADTSCVQIPRKPDFSNDTDAAIEVLRTHKPSMFVFSNPGSPTSLVLAMEDVRNMVLAAEACGTLLVLDEAYMDFCDQSLLDEIEQHSNLVILRTCSKAAGLAGLRLGFAVANTTLTRALRAAKSPYNVGALTQEIGLQLLSQPERLMNGIAQIRQNTNELSQGLRALNLQVVGDAANFVFVQNAGQYFEPLKARGIVVRRMGEHLRITAGSQEENTALLQALKELV